MSLTIPEAVVVKPITPNPSQESFTDMDIGISQGVAASKICNDHNEEWLAQGHHVSGS
jgi:hypothetical protein